MGRGWKDGILGFAAGVWDVWHSMAFSRQNIRNWGNLDIWGFGVWDLRVCMGGWRIGVCGRCGAGSMTNKGAGAFQVQQSNKYTRAPVYVHCTMNTRAPEVYQWVPFKCSSPTNTSLHQCVQCAIYNVHCTPVV